MSATPNLDAADYDIPTPRAPGQAIDITTALDNTYGPKTAFQPPAANSIQWVRVIGLPVELTKVATIMKQLPESARSWVVDYQRLPHHDPTIQNIDYLIGSLTVANQLLGPRHVQTPGGVRSIVPGPIVLPPPEFSGTSAAQQHARLPTTYPATVQLQRGTIPLNRTVPDYRLDRRLHGNVIDVHFASEEDAKRYRASIAALEVDSLLLKGIIGNEDDPRTDRERDLDEVDVPVPASSSSTSTQPSSSSSSSQPAPNNAQTPFSQQPNIPIIPPPHPHLPTNPLNTPLPNSNDTRPALPSTTIPSASYLPSLTAPASIVPTPSSIPPPVASANSVDTGTNVNPIGQVEPNAVPKVESTAAVAPGPSDAGRLNESVAINVPEKWFARFSGDGSVKRTRINDWLISTTPSPKLISQVGDFVAYIARGHAENNSIARATYSLLNLPTSAPGGVDPSLGDIVFGEVVEMDVMATQPEMVCLEVEVYVRDSGGAVEGGSGGDAGTVLSGNGGEGSSNGSAVTSTSGRNGMRPVLVDGAQKTLRIAFVVMDACADFVVLYDQFVDCVLGRRLEVGERVIGMCADGERGGKVIGVAEHVENECWKGVSVEWDGSEGKVEGVGAWEVRREGEGWAWERRMCSSGEVKHRIEFIFANCNNNATLTSVFAEADTHAEAKHMGVISSPITWTMIQGRLANDYYRSVKAIGADIHTLCENIKLVESDQAGITALIGLREEVLGVETGVGLEGDEGKRKRDRDEDEEEGEGGGWRRRRRRWSSLVIRCMVDSSVKLF
ncbi:hypothetical protein HDV00_002008 [Rhizophlyctis rosea]|nr:hypothetical protein HDV00_002008 [Rhizophlyctis rosea]